MLIKSKVKKVCVVNIISNISSKSEMRVGKPFFVVNGEHVKIKKDEVIIDKTGSLNIEIGYEYGGSKLVNLSTKIVPSHENEYYKYTVPLSLNGRGKLKKIGKIYYQLYKMYRCFLNSWWGIAILTGILLLLLIC